MWQVDDLRLINTHWFFATFLLVMFSSFFSAYFLCVWLLTLEMRWFIMNNDKKTKCKWSRVIEEQGCWKFKMKQIFWFHWTRKLFAYNSKAISQFCFAFIWRPVSTVFNDIFFFHLRLTKYLLCLFVYFFKTLNFRWNY